MAHKLIINKKNYNVISCDKSCIPLKQIFENVVQENKIKITHTKENFLKYKIPTLTLIGINIIIYLITAFLSGNIFDINSSMLSEFWS